MRRQVLRDGTHVFLRAHKQVLDGLFQSGTVSHDVTEGGGLAECGRYFEVDVTVDVAIEIQFSLLYELHHTRPGKEFGNGARAKQRVFRRDGNLLFVIGVAVAFREERFAVLDYGDDSAGDVRAPQL